MVDELVEQATTLNGNEAPQGKRRDDTETYRQHYRRLALANNPNFNGQWRDEERSTVEDNAAIVDAIGGQLELTTFQKDRAREALVKLPSELLGAYQSALIALCICGLVGRRDGRDYHPNNAHPNSDTESKFVDIFEATDTTYTRLYSCWERMEQEL